MYDDDGAARATETERLRETIEAYRAAAFDAFRRDGSLDAASGDAPAPGGSLENFERGEERRGGGASSRDRERAMRGVYAAVATRPRDAARATVAAAGAKRGRRGAAASDTDDDDDDDDELSSEELVPLCGGVEIKNRWCRRRGVFRGGAPGSGIGGLGHADDDGGGTMCWCGALDASRCKVPRRLTAAANAVASALRSSRALAGCRAVVRELARSKASERAALEADGVPSSRSPERLRAWRDVVEEEAALTHAAAIAELAPVVDDVCEARL